MPDLMTATSVQPPPDPECPPWCIAGHLADRNGPTLWTRNHIRAPRYVDLQGYPGAFVMVSVWAEDTWTPTTPTTPTAWKRDHPMVLVTPEPSTEPMRIWNVPSLRPILKAGPLLMPGLLELIIEAVEFCGIKIPQEYTR